MRDKVSIGLTDRPNIHAAINNPETAKETVELLKLFMDLADEALSEEKGIRWVDLPKKFHKDLTLSDLIKGVLRGTLDVEGINPELFSTLGHAVHPLALFTVKEGNGMGGVKTSYSKWREHYDMQGQVDEETISKVIQNILRYARWIDFKTLYDAMRGGSISPVYRGLADEHTKRLPFYPALRYQEKLFGELGGVGKFWEDIGAFECGEFPHEEEYCPACKTDYPVEIGNYLVCPTCNAGFKAGVS